jgi:hypothetical protein
MSAQGLGCSLIPGVVVKLSRTSLPGPGFSPKDLNSHAVKALLVSRALLVKIKRDLEDPRAPQEPRARYWPSEDERIFAVRAD